MEILIGLTPWALLFVYVALRFRLPAALPEVDPRGPSVHTPATAGPPPPLVSIIVPARNEARNILACLVSLTESNYPNFEIVVVDDRSNDSTASLAATVTSGTARSIRIVEGEPLPAGWFGKPWACMQGARVAAGDLFVFTDADTTHRCDLLNRAVASLRDERADAISLLGRQLMGSFWEKLIQPQVFALLLLRYPDAGRTRAPDDWKNAVANGQFIMIRRTVYEQLGGHGAVAGEVVEDLRLAQELVRAGYRLSIREAEDSLSTRMYRSLGDLVEGWSKNLWTAARQSAPRWARSVVVPIAILVNAALWILPPLVWITFLLSGASGGPVPPIVIWALAATAAGVLFWTAAVVRVGAPAVYGLLYPLGMVVTGYITARSWFLGSRITWKGRTYGGRSR